VTQKTVPKKHDSIFGKNTKFIPFDENKESFILGNRSLSAEWTKK